MNLELIVRFMEEPQQYFQEVQGSKQRYRIHLEKTIHRKHVGKYLHHPMGEPFESFLKRDIKKYARHIK